MVESEQCTIAVALKVLTGPGLAASALPGIRLEVQILRPYLRPPSEQLWGWGLAICFNHPSGWF